MTEHVRVPVCKAMLAAAPADERTKDPYQLPLARAGEQQFACVLRNRSGIDSGRIDFDAHFIDHLSEGDQQDAVSAAYAIYAKWCHETGKRAPAEPTADDELAKVKDALQDPDQVHIGMLRGTIARITRAQWLHAEGDGAQELDAAMRDYAIEAAIAEFESEQVAAGTGWFKAGDLDARVQIILADRIEYHPDNPTLVRVREGTP